MHANAMFFEPSYGDKIGGDYTSQTKDISLWTKETAIYDIHAPSYRKESKITEQ